MPYGWDTLELSEADQKWGKVWVCDTAHTYPTMRPLCCHCWVTQMLAMQVGAETLCEPTSKGLCHKLHNGHDYITVVMPRNEEIPEREKLFREKIVEYIDDPFGVWDRWKAELKQMYDRFIPFDVEHASIVELTEHLNDCYNMNWRMWVIHHISMPGYYCVGFPFFRDICVELTGVRPTDVIFAKLMTGFDNSEFQLNKGLAELATKAMELKLEDNFKLPDEEVLTAMEQSDAGREWLKAFRNFLNTYGFRMQRMIEYCTPSWNEKPSLVIRDIRQSMAIGGVHVPDLQRERLVREREELEKEMLAKVPSDQREWFGKLMRCAQAAHFYSEDHAYWCEIIGLSLFRRSAIEFGKRFFRAGVLDDPEDVNMLRFDQLMGASIRFIQERADLLSIVRRNKEEWGKYFSEPPGHPNTPMLLGDPAHLPQMIAADGIVNVHAGVPIAKPEEVGATCVGGASAPGVVDGVARVIMSADELGQVQPGEIIVVPATDIGWTPAFGLVKAVVTDSGGMLSHAVIVAREYGIPAVCGCMDATAKIKTGDKIKVDGNKCMVYVLH